MRRNLLSRGLEVAIAGGLVLGSFAVTTPAGAAPPPGGTGPTYVVAAGGSDTTETLMEAFLLGKTTSAFGPTTYNVTTYNIPWPRAGTNYNVPNSDGQCNAVETSPGSGTFVAGYGAGITAGGITYLDQTATATPPKAPQGSGAGRTYLDQQRSVGGTGQKRACIDLGRSSSFSSSGVAAGKEFYAFALDSVGVATTSLKAPATLTRADVKNIYNCTFTDWSQIPNNTTGVAGPIQRYIAKVGSGTRETFLTEWLDMNSSDTDAAFATAAGCPAIVSIEENQMQTINVDDTELAIMPFSAAVWTYQRRNADNPSLDKRNNARMIALRTAPTSGSPVIANPIRWNATNDQYEINYKNFSNPSAPITDTNIALFNSTFNKATGYSGVRTVFNVVDPANELSYEPAAGLVGFDNTVSGWKSPLCNGSSASVLTTYAFAPLDTSNPQNNGVNTNNAGSTCRKIST